MQAGLPYKRGELFPAMGGLLSRLALHDAANVIRSHVLPWLERREQAAAMITKQYVQTVYSVDSTHPLSEKNVVLFGRMVALIFAKT